MAALAHRKPDAGILKQFSYVESVETCLPALPTVAIDDDGCRRRNRTVTRVTSLRKGTFATSLVGAKDIRGRGSHFSEVPHADPFILVHFVETAMRIKPPFCAHPHLGTEVASLLLRGEEVWPWDNLKGFEETKLHAGGVYLCSTGRGLVHDESESPPFPDRRVMRAAFDAELEGGNEPCAPGDTRSQFVQCWWNAGYIYETPLPECTTQLVAPENIPLCVIPGGMAVRVLIGDLPAQGGGGDGGHDNGVTARCSSPVKQRGTSPVLLLHARVAPGGDATLSLPAAMNGFLFVNDPDGGRVIVGSTPSHVNNTSDGGTSSDELLFGGDIEGKQMAKLPPGGTDLRFRNPSSEKPCELLIFLGMPVRKPYCKYVGYGGAMVHHSRELVEEAMAVYERDPKNFGREDSSAQIDWSKYYLVEGFQNRGGPGYERGDGIKARFAEMSDGKGGNGGGAGVMKE